MRTINGIRALSDDELKAVSGGQGAYEIPFDVVVSCPLPPEDDPVLWFCDDGRRKLPVPGVRED